MLLILIINFIDVKHKHVIYSVATPVVCMCQSLNPFSFYFIHFANMNWHGCKTKVNSIESLHELMEFFFLQSSSCLHHTQSFSMMNTIKKEERTGSTVKHATRCHSRNWRAWSRREENTHKKEVKRIIIST